MKHSELVAKFLSPECDDFNKMGLISIPKHAIGSAGEFAGEGNFLILIHNYHCK